MASKNLFAPVLENIDPEPDAKLINSVNTLYIKANEVCKSETQKNELTKTEEFALENQPALLFHPSGSNFYLKYHKVSYSDIGEENVKESGHEDCQMQDPAISFEHGKINKERDANFVDNTTALLVEDNERNELARCYEVNENT